MRSLPQHLPFRLKNPLLLLCILSLFSYSSASFAEDITYTGDPADLASPPLFTYVGLSGIGIIPQDSQGQYPASNNRVVIDFTPTGANEPDFVFGGLGNIDSTGDLINISEKNTVTFKQGVIKDKLFGGASMADTDTGTATATARDNTTNITDNAKVMGRVYGGYADSYANPNNNPSVVAEISIATANNNTINISGHAELNGIIYGGFADALALSPSMTGTANATASNNTINISDNAIINNHITGGYANTSSTTTSISTATNNTINISGNPTFAVNREIYGGFSQTVGPGTLIFDTFTGNTLNFASSPITINRIANFAHYNFSVDPVLANAPTPLISATDIVLGSDASNMSSGTADSTIQVKGVKAGKILKQGDEFVLMQGNITGHNVSGSSTGMAQQGISLLYDVETTVTMGAAGNVVARVSGVSVNPQLKALSEGRMAGAMLVTRGADVIADEAIEAIRNQNTKYGLSPFAIFSGGKNRYNSGSHIKSDNFFLTAGLSYQQEKVTAGAFLESGWGSYDTYNSFSHAANVDGDGNAKYYGMGLLGRYDLSNGAYTEASLRLGQSRTKFSTDDLVNFSSGENARYDSKSFYMSAHLGGGYVIPVDEKNSVDVSVKYLWSHVNSDKVTVAGDAIRFDSVDSHRTRLNAQWNHVYSEVLTLNAGLGYEYEFDGKAKATALGDYDIGAPSVKGSTGIVSLGARITPTSNKHFAFDLRAHGTVGKREGGGASVHMNYRF